MKKNTTAKANKTPLIKLGMTRKQLLDPKNHSIPFKMFLDGDVFILLKKRVPTNSSKTNYIILINDILRTALTPIKSTRSTKLSIKDLRKLIEKYELIVNWSQKDKSYISYAKEVAQCKTHGPTESVAIKLLKEALTGHLIVMQQTGLSLPKPNQR